MLSTGGKNTICGISSFGRASACHAEGDGFEPRISLHVSMVEWLIRQVVALESEGSIPSRHPNAVSRFTAPVNEA